MLSTTTAGSFSFAEKLATFAVPTAFAAEKTMHVLDDPLQVPLLTYGWMMLFILMGWAAANLPLLAKWKTGNLEERLKIVQTFLVSLVAGIVAFFGGRWAGFPDMGSFLGIAVFSYMGSRALEWAFTKITSSTPGPVVTPPSPPVPPTDIPKP